MPLDSSRFDESTLHLIDAKQILIEKGWCTGTRLEGNGNRCALGALDAVIGQMASPRHLAVVRLADAVPTGLSIIESEQADYKVARFNNMQGNIDPILQWFDRAIAGHSKSKV